MLLYCDRFVRNMNETKKKTKTKLLFVDNKFWWNCIQWIPGNSEIRENIETLNYHIHSIPTVGGTVQGKTTTTKTQNNDTCRNSLLDRSQYFHCIFFSSEKKTLATYRVFVCCRTDCLFEPRWVEQNIKVWLWRYSHKHCCDFDTNIWYTYSCQSRARIANHISSLLHSYLSCWFPSFMAFFDIWVVYVSGSAALDSVILSHAEHKNFHLLLMHRNYKKPTKNTSTDDDNNSVHRKCDEFIIKNLRLTSYDVQAKTDKMKSKKINIRVSSILFTATHTHTHVFLTHACTATLLPFNDRTLHFEYLAVGYCYYSPIGYRPIGSVFMTDIAG